MIWAEKQRLRERIRRLSPGAPALNSKSWTTQIMNHDTWKRSSNVLLYSPLTGEPDLGALVDETMESERKFFFPRIEGNDIALYRQMPGSRWVKGPFGLNEPDPNSWEQAAVAEIHMVLVPGLAFDRGGGRLGRGKGFYDRLLGHPSLDAPNDSSIIKVGVAWSWQLLESIPMENHDVRMDYLVTEETFLSTKAEQPGSGLDKRL